MRLFKATVECAHCERKFHQIDGTEERALRIAEAACEGHVKTEHPWLSEPCSCGSPDATSLDPAEVVVHRRDGQPCTIAPRGI